MDNSLARKDWRLVGLKLVFYANLKIFDYLLVLALMSCCVFSTISEAVQSQRKFFELDECAHVGG